MNNYKLEPLPIEARKIVVIAFAVTLFIFLVLPLADVIFRRGMVDRLLRDIDTVVIFQPPLEREEPELKPPATKEIPKLEEKMPRQMLPMHIAANLMLGMGDAGDFALSFGIGDAVFELFEIDSHPYPISQISPLYPMAAKHKGIEGEVELAFVVRADGTVDNIEVVSSYPGDVFTHAAINAVRQWRFKPGIKGGRPVDVRVFLPLKFHLE